MDSGFSYDGPEGYSNELQQVSQTFTFTVSSGFAQLDPTLFQLQIPALLNEGSNLPAAAESEIFDLLAARPGGGSPTGLVFAVVDRLESGLISTLCAVERFTISTIDKGICGP